MEFAIISRFFAKEHNLYIGRLGSEMGGFEGTSAIKKSRQIVKLKI
jgi:hypothetical protein